MHGMVKSSLNKVKWEFDDLVDKQKNLNKYQLLCIEAIKNDLESMIGFVSSLELLKENDEKEKGENLR